MSFFEGKIAIITGAGGSIGAAVAIKLVEAGARVVLVDYNEESLKKVVADMNVTEGCYLTIKADVSKEEDVVNYVNKAVETFGGIDLFVNNAGVEGDKCDIIDYSIESFDHVVAVNFRGAFLGLKYVLCAMRKADKGGAIVNTGSCASLKGMPMTIGYVGTKHAVYGMTKTAAVENGPHGIRVNCVCPANVEGPMMRRFEERECKSLGLEVTTENLQKVKEMGAAMSPIQRYCQPEEIADAVMYLLDSDKAGFVTGAALPIDGGLTL